MRKCVLVTGGTGFIGSHTCVELLDSNYDVVVIDNLCNSREQSLERVRQICGQSVAFNRVDLLDERSIDEVFERNNIDAVIHFAALKAVGESVREPLEYYHNNVTGLLNLLRVMVRRSVFDFVYSSSATVYGEANPIPYVEDQPLSSASPYGRSKVMAEQILTDLQAADDRWNIISLRYFNPVGAHPSGLIGEDPLGIPNNLMPYVSQVAIGRRDCVSIFGNDYDTPDGTGVRDYIHVVDLAAGHVMALDGLENQQHGFAAYNLGSGQGHSVLQVIDAFEQACGKGIPYRVEARRPGDIDEFYANVDKAVSELGWRADRDLGAMCADCWNWQSRNPNGYEDV